MRLLTTFPLLLIAMLPPAATAGEIYRHVDKNGNTVFTDQPPEDDETVRAVELAPINRIPGAKPPAGGKEKPGTPVATPPYGRLYIGGVKQGDFLANPDYEIVITSKPDSPLQQGHRIVVVHNGVDVAVGEDGIYRIPRIDRGQHNLRGEVRDAQGQIIISSETLTFDVRRPHRP